MPPLVYQVRVRGHLPQSWTEELSGMQLQCEPDGCTFLVGTLPDQAALYGLLTRIRDLGLELISLNRLDRSQDWAGKFDVKD